MSYKPAAQSKNAVISVTEEQKSMASTVALYRPKIEAVMPRHMHANWFLEIINTEMRNNPNLARCDKLSFLAAVFQAARLGLAPGSGLIHLIPFGKVVQVLIDYKGLIDIIERPGRIKLDAQCVYENDELEMLKGTSPSIHHRLAKTNRGKLIGAYAVAHQLGGSGLPAIYEWCSLEDIEKARKASRSGNGPAWTNWYDRMARKTPVRRLATMLRQSGEIEDQRVMRAVNMIETSDELGTRQVLPDAEEILGIAPTIEMETFTDEEKMAIERSEE